MVNKDAFVSKKNFDVIKIHGTTIQKIKSVGKEVSMSTYVHVLVGLWLKQKHKEDTNF
jgi:hypothetical protein